MAKTKWIVRAGGSRARVDYRDWLWARKHRWHNDRGYTKRGIAKDGTTISFLLHREIMQRIRGGRKIPKNLVVDHINRKRHDNRRCNLRLVSVKKNNHNRHNILLWDGERWVYEPHGRL